MQRESSVSSDAEATSSTCTFCQLNCIATYIMKETATFRIVADHAPLLEGHLLIVPKAHYACYGAVPAALDAELLALKREVQQFFACYYAPPVFWEHGVFRQTVFHAHLHCFPFGDLAYPLDQARHQRAVNSQDDVRAWYAEHGHYFYLGDMQRAFLFDPNMIDYQYIVQHVLGPGVLARSAYTGWRTTQQRQVEGKPLVEHLITNWRAFQQ